MSKREFKNKIAYRKMARQKMRLENIILTALLCVLAFTITFVMAGHDGVEKADSMRNRTGNICEITIAE